MLQALICLVDKKTGDKSKTRPRFVKQDQVAIMRVECAGVICMEQFKLFPQMGRFTLRDEGNSLFCQEICSLILYYIFNTVQI
jgi:peptide chain release factor subunit 3